MEFNGNGGDGDRQNGDDLTFGPFRVEARQLRSFYALIIGFSALIIAFMAWESAASGDAKTWHAIIAGAIRGFLWNVLTGALMALAAINILEATMGKINPLAAFGTGKGPKWLRDKIDGNVERYAGDRIAAIKAEAERDKAEAERDKAEAVAAAEKRGEARGRELGRREAEEARLNGDSPPEADGR